MQKSTLFIILLFWPIELSLGLNLTVRPEKCSDSGICNASLLNQTPDLWQEHGFMANGDNYVYVNLTPTAFIYQDEITSVEFYFDKHQGTLEGNLSLHWLNNSEWAAECAMNFSNSTYHAHDRVACGNPGPEKAQFNSGLGLRADFLYSGSEENVSFGTDEVYALVNYTRDTSPPTVELVYPNSYVPVGPVNFSYIPSDTHLRNCTLFGDFNGSWQANATDLNVTTETIDSFIVSLANGSYTWNVYCCDVYGQCAFDGLGGINGTGNFSFNTTYPDLAVMGISFSGQIKDNGNVTITSTVGNIGRVNFTGTVIIQAFLDDPESGGTQIGSNITLQEIRAGQNATANVSLIVPRDGPLYIYAVIDPPNTTGGVINETEEGNNVFNATLNIPAYQLVYGFILKETYLGSGEHILFKQASSSNISGNILAFSDEMAPDFTALQALSLNITNSTSTDDFSELDSILNITHFNDSISKIYSDGFGMPKETMNTAVYNRTILNIPSTNSSSEGNFKTGILWDMNDGGSEYNGSQDIVFITAINQYSQGIEGIYDYEVIFPAELATLSGGLAIRLYAEIR